MKKISFLLATVIMLSSCATVFAPRRQKVSIDKPKDAELKINDEAPVTKKGKYVLDKYDVGSQITIQRDGYKDQNKVYGTYKTHYLRYALSAPLGVLTFGYTYFLDRGPKSKNYDKEIKVGYDMIPLPTKDEEDKEIQINNISANIAAEDIKQRYFTTFKKYYKRNDKEESSSIGDVDNIEVENTIFTDVLNNILKESGYIDTSNKALKNSFSNNLFLNANISGITFHRVGQNKMIYADITIDWELLDYYKKPIYSETKVSQSGEYTTFSGQDLDDVIEMTITDATEVSLLEFLNNKEVQKLLSDRSVAEKEKSFTPIRLPKSSEKVSSIKEALKSSVTIKSTDGHGSGFIVSPEGHILTTYFVVSDSNDIKVILNDGSELNGTLVRASKLNNLALIKIDKKGLVPFNLSPSKDIEIGSTVYAIGTPSSKSLSQSISKGIISGARKSEVGTNVIQTDVSINTGNNGGALVDENGVVVGIVSSKLIGRNVEGVAFGLPAFEILDKLNIN